MANRTGRVVPLVGLLVFAVISGVIAVNVRSTQTISWCPGSVCYYLYTFNDTGGGTWTSALEECEAHGRHLTAVWDQRVQDELNQAPLLGSTVNAWLAGRRGDNDTFVWLDGNTTTVSSAETCGQVYRESFSAKRCTLTQPCLCSRLRDPDCPFDEALYEDHCFWSTGTTSTWYDCRSFCLDQGGDLASLSGDVGHVTDQLTDKTGVDHYNRYMWVGLHKLPWHWVTVFLPKKSLRRDIFGVDMTV